MIPDLWGKYLWKSIHYIALGFPEKPTPEEVYNYYNFFINLEKVIPCYKCSINYKRNLIELPIDEYLSSKMKLFEWTVNMHNLVNKELNKPIISINDAINIYNKKDIVTTNNQLINNNIYIYIIIIILLLILIFILLFKFYYNYLVYII